jgi:tRNA threonylcarbamoyladenosine biosynthesis protein TsaE
MRPFHHVVPGLASRGRISLARDELIAWGEAFGRAAHAPLIVTLAGDLGAGKTTLAQAICRGYGAVDAVTSPTFALVHEYAGGPTAVYHLDLYRLTSDAPGGREAIDELEAIGWYDIIGAHALVIIEWPERAGARIPVDHVPVELEHDPSDASRRILLAG